VLRKPHSSSRGARTKVEATHVQDVDRIKCGSARLGLRENCVPCRYNFVPNSVLIGYRQEFACAQISVSGE